MKRGRSEPVALTEAYHGTEQDLKRAWLALWQRGIPQTAAKNQTTRRR